MHRGGTYLCIEGPQFSTKAESRIYRSWGVDVIGMTNMPEAKLAREAELCYATLALVTDYDVWHETHAAVTVEAVIQTLLRNVATAKDVLRRVIPAIGPAAHVPRARASSRTRSSPRPAAFPLATRRRLDLLIGKYFPPGGEEAAEGPGVADLDVVGIGNALVDVLSRESDAFLTSQGLTKGAMQLVDEAPARASSTRRWGPAIEVSGGSAANTIVGVASFGGRAALRGQGARRPAGRGVPPRPARPSASATRRAPGHDRPPDRALPDRRHARRPAHAEHLSRRVRPPRRRPTSTER